MSSPRSIVPLLVLIALLTAGCGSSNSKKSLLTQREATRLEKTVDEVDQLVSDNKCDQAHTVAEKGSTQAQTLPPHVSQRLQTNLVRGFDHLVQTIETDCQKPEKTPSPTPSPTETPTQEPTPSPTPTPTPTPSPSPSPTPSPTPTATATATPDNGGANGDGNGNGNQVIE